MPEKKWHWEKPRISWGFISWMGMLLTVPGAIRPSRISSRVHSQAFSSVSL